MTNRFPRGLHVSYTKRAAPVGSGRLSGYDWEISDKSGAVIAFGWSAGTKSEARDEAWKALEETGAVVDE